MHVRHFAAISIISNLFRKGGLKCHLLDIKDARIGIIAAGLHTAINIFVRKD